MNTTSKAKIIWGIALMCVITFLAHSQTTRNHQMKAQEFNEPVDPNQKTPKNPRSVPNAQVDEQNVQKGIPGNPRYVPKNQGSSPGNQYYVPGQKQKSNVKLRQVNEGPQGFTSMYTETFPNGQPRARGRYMGGKKNGSWIYYNVTGVPEKVVVYNNDSTVYDDVPARDYYLTNCYFDNDQVCISLPIDWKKSATKDYFFLGACKKRFGINDLYTPSVCITRGEINMSFQEYVNGTFSYMAPEFNYFQINGYQSVVVNKLRRDQYFCTGRYRSLNFGMLITFIPNGHEVYIVSEVALNEPEGSYMKYHDLFVEIANSVSFH